MKSIRFALLLILITYVLPSPARSQSAFGLRMYSRAAIDHVGPTYGYGLHTTLLVNDGFTTFGLVGAGLDISAPRVFSATASMNSHTTLTNPNLITVPANLKVTDYTLRLELGVSTIIFTNDVFRLNSWIPTLEFRGIFRQVKIDYDSSFNESAYNQQSISTEPYIPKAVKLGINIGAGYLFMFKKIALFPHVGFGFGSNNWLVKHPWNFYPNYIELSLSALYITNQE